MFHVLNECACGCGGKTPRTFIQGHNGGAHLAMNAKQGDALDRHGSLHLIPLDRLRRVLAEESKQALEMAAWK